MTMTPSPRFLQRPSIPSAGSAEDLQWRKNFVLAYKGGTLTSARGNFEQTFKIINVNVSYCSVPDETIERKSHTRTNTIGGTATTVKAANFKQKKFPVGSVNQAGAGQVVRIITGVGSYSARLTGSVQALLTYMCSVENSIYDYFTVVTEQGTIYGPVRPTSLIAP